MVWRTVKFTSGLLAMTSRISSPVKSTAVLSVVVVYTHVRPSGQACVQAGLLRGLGLGLARTRLGWAVSKSGKVPIAVGLEAGLEGLAPGLLEGPSEELADGITVGTAVADG